jgi:tetratricopeptide (TPR) repeat protein
MPLFSPDGRWLATTPDGGQLWSVGDWKPGASLHALGTTPSGLDLAFSPDSSVLAVSQPQGTTRLVDPLSGADWAELLRSDPRRSSDLCFSPDQSLLIEMPLGDRSEPRVWRLREIRRELASRGLDWPADVLPARAAADANPPTWTVVLNAGNLMNQQAAVELVGRAAGLKNLVAKQWLQQAIEFDPENAKAHNELAWLLVTAPDELRDSPAAVRHARRALELNADKATYWNTLGVALYRDAQYSEAITTLKESLRRGGEPTAGFDLIFLALCHQALGNQELARQNLKEATAWFESRRMKLSSAWLDELTGFFKEANAKLPVAE